MMQQQQMIDLAAEFGKKHGIEPQLVFAIMMTETKGDQWGTRFEADWRYLTETRNWSLRLTRGGRTLTEDTERVQQKTSWGVMQPMGSVVRELGFTGLLVELSQPELSVEYGCLQLKRLQRTYGADKTGILGFDEAIVCAYNHGHPERGEDGQWINQAYVSEAKTWYARAKSP